MADVKKDVNDIVFDLKTKMDNLNVAANQVDASSKDKANEIKDKAVDVLSKATEKIVEAYQTLSSPEDVEKGIAVVRNKSKELYDDAMKKIDEIKKSKSYKNTVKSVKNTANQVKKETIKFADSTKNDIDDFFAKPEVKQSINSAKLKTVDLAEKAVCTLKQWLKPEGDK